MEKLKKKITAQQAAYADGLYFFPVRTRCLMDVWNSQVILCSKSIANSLHMGFQLELGEAL
jgi:hypothetical protein